MAVEIAPILGCATCAGPLCQGFDDGLPADWQQNTDGDAFCAACLAKSPLDPHECEDETCCAVLAGQERGGVTHAPTATVRVVELRCHCGRRVTVGADPWCVGCVQSAATCDCAALAGQEPAGEAS
jgi:hypothetical protein